MVKSQIPKLQTKKLRHSFFILVFTFCILNLTGCATYKFHHGTAPYDKGYVVSRDDYTMVEYTLGPDNTVPNRKLAKERFLRRKNVVEDYYKKMGLIENRFKMSVWDRLTMFFKLVGGIFRLPAIAVKDYKYEHNPKYREMVKKKEAEEDAREAERIKKIKDELNAYVQQDLARKEPMGARQQAASVVPLPVQAIIPPAPVIEEKAPQPAAEKLILAEKMPAEELPVAKISDKEAVKKVKEEARENARLQAEAKRKEALAHKEELRRQREEEIRLARERRFAAQAEKKLKAQRLQQEKEQRVQGVGEEKTTAIIVAQPLNGYSPLRVHFYGNKSFSPHAGIVSYSWDFGDGDTSSRENPVNTYYSSSFEPRDFKVSLTVQDKLGNTAAATATITVLNK